MTRRDPDAAGRASLTRRFQPRMGNFIHANKETMKNPECHDGRLIWGLVKPRPKSNAQLFTGMLVR